MSFPSDELRELAARAMPLRERLAGGVTPEPDANDGTTVEARLARWRDAVTGEGDAAHFSRRLAFDGLDEQACRSVLGRVWLADGQALPRWATTLNAMVETCGEGSATGTEGVLHPNVPVPFEDVLVPFVVYAQGKVSERTAGALGALGPKAKTALLRQLLASLSDLGALALDTEFQVFRGMEDPLSILLAEPSGTPADPPRATYRRWVDQMLAGGLRAFFGRYPVLARLMATQVDNWIGSVSEFLVRLKSDVSTLAEVFANGRPVGEVVAVWPGLSDPHRGGKSVIAVAFSSGLRVVYKPKDLGVHEAWQDLLSWLNAQGMPERLKTLRVVNRGTYGWVEHVEHRACESREEAQRYYRRAGMLLCLVYALRGSDCHYENIIACGEHPVLIDTETLMRPRFALRDDADGEESAQALADERIGDSVLSTAMLPRWTMGQHGKSLDSSGLGAAEEQDTGFRAPDWENVNTDRMRLVYRDVTTRLEASRVILDGEPFTPESAGDEIVEGFEGMFRCLAQWRDRLLGEGGPLATFRGQPVRVILRGTTIYGRCLHRLVHPEFLRDGADRSIELEYLTQALMSAENEDTVPRAWGVYEAERQAIERLDIPLFGTQTDGASLTADGVDVVEGVWREPSFERVSAHIRALGEDEHARQVALIRTALEIRYAAVSGERPALEDGVEPDLASITPLAKEQLIEAAMAIAEDIHAEAIRGADGSATWVTLGFEPATELPRLEPMRVALYDGRCGVALFLAALHRMTGERDLRDLALAALRPLREQLADPGPASFHPRLPLGGTNGLGAFVYAFARVGRFLSMEELVEEAGRMAELVTDERISGDRRLDVIAGSAGTILGLLACVDGSAGDRALGRAAACGRHLLASRSTACGHRAWQVPWASRPLTGFGHGAAGVAYALLRLYEVTGEHEFLDAAREGVEYESAVYSEDARNWPDFRRTEPEDGGAERFMVGWCAGAPGIGLARLGGLPSLDTPAVREDIEIALATTLACPVRGSDHLCCGNVGRVDFLIEAAHRLARRDLLDEARRRIAWLVRRAAREGHYSLNASPSGAVFCPGLFQGTSGIGYELLRLADPDSVPSVLLWAT